jgi:hypothetical protein
MTGPALDLINYIFKDGVEILEASNANKCILISFGNNEKENLC